MTLVPTIRAGAVFGWALSHSVLTGTRSAGGGQVLGQWWRLTAMRPYLGHSHRLLAVLVPIVGREDVELAGGNKDSRSSGPEGLKCSAAGDKVI